MSDPLVSVIVVSWNVREYLRRCLASVAAASQDVALDVWVVDNGSSDGSTEMVRDAFPATHVLANRENRGFAAANNQALKVSDSEYVLLINPDAELLSGALATMVACLADHPDTAVVGPRLLNSDGSVQSSRRRAPRLATGFVESTSVQQRWPRSWLTDRYYVLDRPDDQDQGVDWLVGACLLVRRAAIRQVGLLDEGFHMYSEEVEWCLRFRRAGWEVVYAPAARVVHHVGQSSGQDVFARHYRFHASKYRLYAMRFGRLASLLLRLWIGGLYLEQVGEELAKLAIVRRNRSMRRQRLRVLARMALWHLTSTGAADA